MDDDTNWHDVWHFTFYVTVHIKQWFSLSGYKLQGLEALKKKKKKKGSHVTLQAKKSSIDRDGA